MNTTLKTITSLVVFFLSFVSIALAVDQPDLAMDYGYLANDQGVIKTQFTINEPVHACVFVVNKGTASAVYPNKVMIGLTNKNTGAKNDPIIPNVGKEITTGTGLRYCDTAFANLAAGNYHFTYSTRPSVLSSQVPDSNTANDEINLDFSVVEPVISIGMQVVKASAQQKDAVLAAKEGFTDGTVVAYKVIEGSPGLFTIKEIPQMYEAKNGKSVEIAISPGDKVVFQGYSDHNAAQFVLQGSTPGSNPTNWKKTFTANEVLQYNSGKLCSASDLSSCTSNVKMGVLDLPDLAITSIDLFAKVNDVILGTSVKKVSTLALAQKGQLCFQVANNGFNNPNTFMTIQGKDVLLAVKELENIPNMYTQYPVKKMSVPSEQPVVDVGTKYLAPDIKPGESAELCYDVSFIAKGKFNYEFTLNSNKPLELLNTNNVVIVPVTVVEAPAPLNPVSVTAKVVDIAVDKTATSYTLSGQTVYGAPGAATLNGKALPAGYVNMYVLTKENDAWRAKTVQTKGPADADRTFSINAGDLVSFEGFKTLAAAQLRGFQKPFMESSDMKLMYKDNKLCGTSIDANKNYFVSPNDKCVTTIVVGYKDIADLKMTKWSLDSVDNAPFVSGDTNTKKLCFEVKNTGLVDAVITSDSIDVKDQLYTSDGKGGYKQGTAVKDSLVGIPLGNGIVKANGGTIAPCYTFKPSYYPKNAYTFTVTTSGSLDFDKDNNKISVPLKTK